MYKIKARTEKILESFSKSGSTSNDLTAQAPQPQDEPIQPKEASPRFTFESHVNQITQQLNKMLDRLQTMQEHKIQQIQDQVAEQHSKAAVCHGADNYILMWGDDDDAQSSVRPSYLQE